MEALRLAAPALCARGRFFRCFPRFLPVKTRCEQPRGGQSVACGVSERGNTAEARRARLPHSPPAPCAAFRSRQCGAVTPQITPQNASYSCQAAAGGVNGPGDTLQGRRAQGDALWAPPARSRAVFPSGGAARPLLPPPGAGQGARSRHAVPPAAFILIFACTAGSAF